MVALADVVLDDEALGDGVPLVEADSGCVPVGEREPVAEVVGVPVTDAASG